MTRAKQLRKWVITLSCLPFCWHAVNGYAQTDAAASQMAQHQDIRIKESAPQIYVVKEGDTLWDISSLFLDKPWLWPQLWRNNIHIQNPHLIYPGDELRLRFDAQGRPEIVVNRPEKKRIKLSPQSDRSPKRGQPIPLLPWSVIQPYLKRDWIMSEQAYEGLPYLLGNRDAGLRFATDDLVLSRAIRAEQGAYQVLRKQSELLDRFGNSLGWLVRDVASASTLDVDLDKQMLVRVDAANFEAKRGDKLKLEEPVEPSSMQLVPAEDVQGSIIANLDQRALLGKYDVAVLDLGERDLQVGNVLGIYIQGPNIYAGSEPKYSTERHPLKSAFDDGNEVIQPAEKVGDLVVFKVFEKASYALITRSTAIIRHGAIVAQP